MAIFSIILFFLFFCVIYFLRKFILNKIIPRIFNLGFLLVAFVLSGFIFSALYIFIDLFVDNQVFKKEFYCSELSYRALDYLYFSFISQLTIGYGDISPTHPLGKVLSMIQGMVGAIFMGGLIASLLDFSKTVLNYIYISRVSFYHCDAASNHNREIFNMDLNIVKSEYSLFTDFRVFLVAEHDDGRRFQVFGGGNDTVNIQNKITFDISQKNIYPRFVDNAGKLAYETFNPTPQSMTPNGMIGGPTIFYFRKLYLKYSYSFESKLYSKEVEIKNKDKLATLLSNLGRHESEVQNHNKH